MNGAELTKYAAEQTAELSDADLEAVAGGSWSGSQSTDIGLAGSAASAAVLVK